MLNAKRPIRTAVIPAAGRGTRLLPVTKETPKEMLPIFAYEQETGELCLKPMLQAVFEQLFDFFLCNADAGIGNRKREPVSIRVRHPVRLDLDQDFSTQGKLGGVAQQVDQNLPQTGDIARDHCRYLVVDHVGQVQQFIRGYR